MFFLFLFLTFSVDENELKIGDLEYKDDSFDNNREKMKNINSFEKVNGHLSTPKPKIVPIVHYLNPETVPEIGRVNFTIHVTRVPPGRCFAKVDGVTIEGVVDESGEAVFKAPPHKVGTVRVQFSSDRLKWHGHLELVYVSDKKDKKNTIISIILGILLASFICCALFYFLTGNKKSNQQTLPYAMKQSSVRHKRSKAKAKKRTVTTLQ